MELATATARKLHKKGNGRDSETIGSSPTALVSDWQLANSHPMVSNGLIMAVGKQFGFPFGKIQDTMGVGKQSPKECTDVKKQ